MISDDSGITFKLLTDGTLIEEITEKNVHEELKILVKKRVNYKFLLAKPSLEPFVSLQVNFRLFKSI